MELKEYSKENLIKLAEKLRNENKQLLKKQEVIERIGELKAGIKSDIIFTILFAIDAGIDLWNCLYLIQENGAKKDIIEHGFWALDLGGFSGFSFHLYNKEKAEKKLLEEELKEEKAFGMTREEFYDMYEKTNHFEDNEPLDPAIAQFTEDKPEQFEKTKK